MKNAGHNGPAPEVQGSDLDNQNPSATSDPAAKHTAAHGETLLEPVVWRFWRNRRGEGVAVSIEPWEGRTLVHVRQFFTDHAGKLAPTKKGICIDVLRLPELAAAVNKALATARELGLIDAEHGP
jgi:Transcriptional Coactivator p15 (PC4)